MSQTKTDLEKACDYCGRTGYLKARATAGKHVRLFCHTAEHSCYNACRGRYFETCKCDKVIDKPLTEDYERWYITRRNPDCRLHIA